MISQHRIILHGEYEYQMYLAERLVRQHSPDFSLRAPADLPQFMCRPEMMNVETITLLQAGIYFDHFLREPENPYQRYIAGHLMPRRPHVTVEFMRAMAVLGGYVPPPAAQPDMPPPLAPVASLEHDVVVPDDDDDDDQHGGKTFAGFDFGDAE